MSKGYIYIMTNPALKDMVKIGFASNVEQRRQQLSTTALPYDYEVYATYETSGNLEDKKLHKLIDKLNPDLRLNKNREFFIMTPEDAYELLETIAIISNTENKLSKSIQHKHQRISKPAINFYECGLQDGDELVYIEDSSVVVTVCSKRKVLFNGIETSLSGIVSDIKGVNSIQGTLYFTYKGEPLIDIANRTQWKE